MKDRKEYQRAYYLANKERIQAAAHKRYEASKEERQIKAREAYRFKAALAMQAYFHVFKED